MLKKIEQIQINGEDKEFLSLVGLPDSAAPFLTFEEDEKGGLCRLKEIYKMEDEYREYVYLGYNASGDIVALDETDGKVVCIDHESLDKQYINGSIVQMAESLLEYADFIKRINKVNGRRAYLNREAPLEELEKIKGELLNIDGNIFQTNSFWKEEIEQFETSQ